MGFAGALRFAGSVLGVGRAPYVVDRWSRNFRSDRHAVRNAFWLSILLAVVGASYPLWKLAFTGWMLAWPIGVGVLLCGLVWDYAFRHHTLASYARGFRARYPAGGHEDFARYANPLWWRWWSIRWLFAGGPEGILDAIITLRVTEPIPWWCRRDRRQLVAVLEDRAEQFWTAYPDFNFRLCLWWLRIIMRVQIWEYFLTVYLLVNGFHILGTEGAWMVGLGITIPVALGTMYTIVADRASARRRELTPAAAEV